MGMHVESWPQRRRITAHDDHRMGEIGVFPPDARVEFIEGEIIDMAPIGNDHQSIVELASVVQSCRRSHDLARAGLDPFESVVGAVTRSRAA